MVMHKREGDREGDVIFPEEHEWLCRRERETGNGT
jgi:hypothetical protein